METNLATFSGGCFWCMIQPFQSVRGVVKVIPGYTGGKTKDPSYEEVSSGKTGHLEAVQVTYNPEETNYTSLLEIFWRQIDPEDDKGQFADQGTQYKTAIFYHDETQKKEAEKSKKSLEESGKFSKVATQILPAEKFWPAEQAHWDYPKKNPVHYKLYKKFSGREAFLKKIWENEK